MTLTELEEQIFSSGMVDCDWENDEQGTLDQVQAVAECIISELLANGEITASQGLDLIAALMDSYD